MLVVARRENGNPRTVELTQKEAAAERLFNSMLTQGLSIPDAVRRVRVERPGLSESFYEWLSL